MIIAIPDDYHGVVPTLSCFRLLEGHDVRVLRDAAPPFERLAALLRDAEIIVPIRERTRFTRELIERLPKLKLFSQTGRSTRHIDVAACTARGIAVAAGTHASPYTVSEHTWALIFASLRPVAEDAALMKRGEWRPSFGTGLRGKTLGILGLGMIGRLVAATGASVGMRVLVWGREASREAARASGYSVADDQRALFRESNVLSINLRFTPDTRGSVTAEDLAVMKPDALLVNAARAESSRAVRSNRRCATGGRAVRQWMCTRTSPCSAAIILCCGCRTPYARPTRRGSSKPPTSSTSAKRSRTRSPSRKGVRRTSSIPKR